MRGRPKRNPGRPAEPCEVTRRTEPWLRIGAGLPQALVGNTVWRIKRRPVWNSWRQNWPPGRLLKAGGGALRCSPWFCGALCRGVPVSGYAAVPKAKCLGRMPLGLGNRCSRSAARGALASWRAEHAGIFKKEGSGGHRAAERDTTGSNGRQHSLHTWIDAPAQGSVKGASHARHTPRYSLQ